MAKEITATSRFKKFGDFCKKMTILSDTLIFLENGMVLIIRNKDSDDAIPAESLVMWKDQDTCKFYGGCMVDPKNLAYSIKENDLKVKNTRVEKNISKYEIYKDEEKIYEIPIMPFGINSEIDKKSYALAIEKYNKLGDYISDIPNLTFSKYSPDEVDFLHDNGYLTYRIDGYWPLTIPKSLFPLMKKTDTDISIALVDFDKKYNKVYLMIKEEYKDFDIYSLIACLAIKLK